MDDFQGEKGPIDYFINDSDEEEEDDDDYDDDDGDAFIVDDDMIDGEKSTDIASEMNKVEMPGNKQILAVVYLYLHQLITIKKS